MLLDFAACVVQAIQRKVLLFLSLCLKVPLTQFGDTMVICSQFHQHFTRDKTFFANLFLYLHFRFVFFGERTSAQKPTVKC
jgi:hypothetical protein